MSSELESAAGEIAFESGLARYGSGSLGLGFDVVAVITEVIASLLSACPLSAGELKSRAISSSPIAIGISRAQVKRHVRDVLLSRVGRLGLFERASLVNELTDSILDKGAGESTERIELVCREVRRDAISS